MTTREKLERLLDQLSEAELEAEYERLREAIGGGADRRRWQPVRLKNRGTLGESGRPKSICNPLGRTPRLVAGLVPPVLSLLVGVVDATSAAGDPTATVALLAVRDGRPSPLTEAQVFDAQDKGIARANKINWGEA